MVHIKNPKTGRNILIGGATYKKLLKENPNIFDDPPKLSKPLDLDESFTEDEQCIVCMNKRACVLLLPCEHNIMCKTCSDKIKGMSNYEYGKKCIMCRQTVEHILD